MVTLYIRGHCIIYLNPTTEISQLGLILACFCPIHTILRKGFLHQIIEILKLTNTHNEIFLREIILAKLFMAVLPVNLIQEVSFSPGDEKTDQGLLPAKIIWEAVGVVDKQFLLHNSHRHILLASPEEAREVCVI